MGNRRTGCELGRNMSTERKAPSLTDLCVRTAIDNVRYLGDLGGIDPELLARILPHCTVDQLMHIERSSKGTDLTPVTDNLWKNFYEKQFGSHSTNLVIERMKDKGVSFRWSQLYEAKSKDIEEAQNKSLDRMRQLYKEKDALKQSRQVRICTKVPPSSNKRRFGCSSYDVSNLKSNIMKKARIETLKRLPLALVAPKFTICYLHEFGYLSKRNTLVFGQPFFRGICSREVKNIAAMKKKAIQREHSISPLTKPRAPSGGGSASSSKVTKPLRRRI